MRNEVTYSDSESNPSYEELQMALIDMHSDEMKTFKKLSSQKKIIFKLDEELSQLKNYFECLKNKHAS